MNVGLPGTGLGGLFYLLTAFLMPVAESIRTLRGRSSLQRWYGVAIVTSLAVGIMAALWGTAWLIDHALVQPQFTHFITPASAHRVTHLLGMTPTHITLMTLGGVLVIVEVLHLLSSIASHWRRL